MLAYRKRPCDSEQTPELAHQIERIVFPQKKVKLVERSPLLHEESVECATCAAVVQLKMLGLKKKPTQVRETYLVPELT